MQEYIQYIDWPESQKSQVLDTPVFLESSLSPQSSRYVLGLPVLGIREDREGEREQDGRSDRGRREGEGKKDFNSVLQEA